ncbi:sugar phosphate isomerase/epimerase [Alicyclobacillus fastidiosus]|uniref:Sugar phosphate isomerase/epimerase n=1 Tax=Alicyclobacillus fastidiosus TaxID=392011 RepID=A0ABY6ZNS9_9BACL|nr:sugar phosphate isomerase/epimerase [Alicyclobacillus fastidiosus]WAH43595.1 sugar phosphate isomerase/epimerase [Alicyclobacillus fastidiosus]GMA59778.1 sugar phosphate isomerase [Alicyclobacillus fastidiosus]
MANIAVQLYTLRELLEQDFAGTLRKVAGAGYQAVELHTYGGLTPQALRSLLDELGFQAVSAHVALARIENELDVVIEEAKTIGFGYIVCPWLPPERRQTKEDFEALTAVLAQASKKVAEAGLVLAYHNHDFEFERFDGMFVLDLLYANTDPSLVQAELDLYWIHRAGQDPVEYVNKYAGRLDLLHMKDASKDDGSFAEVGQGVLDWEKIIPSAKDAGVKWYIVEQDVCKGDPLESIQTSLAFLKDRV